MGVLFGIGVDIGATRVRVCVGDAGGRIKWRRAVSISPPERAEDYVKKVVSLVGLAVRRVPPGSGPVGVGVASVGPLDLSRGGMASPANLPYDFVPLVDPISSRHGVRVALVNDASAAALGERRFGAGQGCDDLVYVTLSTGIGGGAIVDGHLISGKDGNAAEIGHIVVDPGERLPCGCGGRGHWEAYCSGRGIPNLASLMAEEGFGSAQEGTTGRGARTGTTDAASIFRRAAGGDGMALTVVEEVGRMNALGVANAVNMFDPSLVTIGGGVALNNQSMIVNPIRKLVPSYSINRAPEIRITPLGDNAGLLGALCLAFGEGDP